MGTSGCDRFRTRRRRLRAVRAKERVHTDQASHAAARRLIPPTHPTYSSALFPCPFSHNTTLQHDRLPSVTTTVTSRGPREYPPAQATHEDIVVAERMRGWGTSHRPHSVDRSLEGKPTQHISRDHQDEVVPGKRRKKQRGTPTTFPGRTGACA